MTRRKRRWSDNDRHLGPFTFSLCGPMRYGAELDTGGGYDGLRDDGACVRFYAFRLVAIVELPTILRRGHEYGAYLCERMVHVHYGPQTMDSDTSRSKCWSVPWLDWRHVRHSIYGLAGELFANQQKGEPWHAWFEMRNACPSASFEFDDFDGERIVAKTRIEEMEWRLGTRWCKWLSFFRSPRILRSLDIQFSKETGERKGSWKGGTIGHSIEMVRGELHGSAFRRYCGEHRMTFRGRIDPLTCGCGEELPDLTAASGAWSPNGFGGQVFLCTTCCEGSKEKEA
jgi:hypothetical protein